MKLIQVRHFKAVHEICSDYFVFQDLNTLKLFLFRGIEQYELAWYLFGQNENFDCDLMAVKLREVLSIDQAEDLVVIMWDVVKHFRNEGRKKNEK